jgi:hypothetical protein
MKKSIRSLAVVTVLAIGGVMGTAVVASAAEEAPTAFLCPVVGDGVLNADYHNGDNGVSAIQPPVGTSFLPGNNQAGANANPSAYNSDGPGNPDAGPGHNPDFSPIWPG